jgi:pyruvate formate lyase activating enzyme
MIDHRKSGRKTCRGCKSEAVVASELGYCRECLVRKRPGIESEIRAAHERGRAPYGLPTRPPDAADGSPCTLCVNRCRIPEGGTGYCGVRSNGGGRLISPGGPTAGFVDWYHDLLPTNCVADWVCPGGSPAGFPKYSYSESPEHGYKNLAVFYHACTFDCLYCQNWHFKKTLDTARPVGADALAAAVDERTSCICYFGGDPAPQLAHALEASRIAREKHAGRILRICFETNGSMSPVRLEPAASLAMESGGCIKFDLKAFDPTLHIALTGSENRYTLENFKRLGARVRERPDPPFLIASTLLVPGYVEQEEVRAIARFIASVDPGVPYTLLAFSPHFLMRDLPLVSAGAAAAAERAARQEGLERVRIGNVRLLD